MTGRETGANLSLESCLLGTVRKNEAWQSKVLGFRVESLKLQVFGSRGIRICRFFHAAHETIGQCFGASARLAKHAHPLGCFGTSCSPL